METYFQGNNSFNGVGRIILGVFRQILGVDWEIVYPPDHEIGYVGLDNKPRGLVKMLMEDVKQYKSLNMNYA